MGCQLTERIVGEGYVVFFAKHFFAFRFWKAFLNEWLKTCSIRAFHSLPLAQRRERGKNGAEKVHEWCSKGQAKFLLKVDITKKK
jgi:hypothetical protein